MSDEARCLHTGHTGNFVVHYLWLSLSGKRNLKERAKRETRPLVYHANFSQVARCVRIDAAVDFKRSETTEDTEKDIISNPINTYRKIASS